MDGVVQRAGCINVMSGRVLVLQRKRVNVKRSPGGIGRRLGRTRCWVLARRVEAMECVWFSKRTWQQEWCGASIGRGGTQVALPVAWDSVVVFPGAHAVLRPKLRAVAPPGLDHSRRNTCVAKQGIGGS